jgi:hypothetical protein
MADEQAIAEAPATEEIQEQTPEVSTEVVEETTEETAEPDHRGDLRVPLQEERRKRQEYERMLADPQFIYQQAKKLGLAEDDGTTPAPTAQPSGPTVPDVAQLVEHQLDFRETIKAHPELDPQKGDPALVKWAAALVDSGHKPSEAADIIFSTMNKRVSQAKVAGAKEKEQAILQKEAATSVSSTASTTSEAAEEAELNARIHDWRNPKAQNEAILEQLKRRMR